MSASSSVTRLRTLWQHADFLKLWAGQSISLLGSQVTTLALPLTAVIILKASSFQVGLLYAAEFAPYLFLTLFAGVWIDHHRRRPILVVTNIGRAILLSLVPLFALFGQLPIELLYTIAFLVGCFTVFFSLAFQAFLPTLVKPDELVEGNSKLSASQSIAEIGGPGLAGVLVQVLSAPFAILIDALSFCIATITLFMMHPSEPQPSAQGSIRRSFGDIGESFRINMRHPYLRAFAGEAATYNLFWQVILTVFVLYAVRNLHLSSGLIGVLFAVGSIGALLGALFTGFLARRFGIGRIIVGAAILGDIPLLVLPFVTHATLGGFSILLGAFFLQGLGLTACNVHVDSIRQMLIPHAIQGRINASYRLLVSGAIPLGALLGGWLGEWIGLQATLLIGSVGLLSTCLWIVFSPVRSIKRYDEVASNISL